LAAGHRREGDADLRKWGVLWVAGAAWLALAATPALAGGGSVSGVVTNWYQVKDKVSPKAFFQFVKKEEKLASGTDKEGLGAITSNLPQIVVRSSGGFQANAAGLPPGDYFIALQRGLPSAPIVVKDGSPLIIKVPGKFPLNVGSVKLEMPIGKGPARHHMEEVK
jgi:hypothetical protein